MIRPALPPAFTLAIDAFRDDVQDRCEGARQLHADLGALGQAQRARRRELEALIAAALAPTPAEEMTHGR